MVAFSFFLPENTRKLMGTRLHWVTCCGMLGKLLNLALSFSFPICKRVIPLIRVPLRRVPTSQCDLVQHPARSRIPQATCQTFGNLSNVTWSGLWFKDKSPCLRLHPRICIDKQNVQFKGTTEQMAVIFLLSTQITADIFLICSFMSLLPVNSFHFHMLVFLSSGLL